MLDIPIKAGIGLRSDHYKEVISNFPNVAWWEIHTENFFAKGGNQLTFLEKIAERYPLSFHGVGLSLGSADGIREQHLKQVKNLVDRFKPSLVSDHISWSNFGKEVLNDLLPIPYNEESVVIISDNIKRVQDCLGRQILVENPSSYTAFKDSTMSEVEFICRIVDKASCHLLLDLNNIYVSANNLGFSAQNYIDGLISIKDHIKEMHLAGHSILQNQDKQIFLVDTHDDYVCPDVWSLYHYALLTLGCKPTLIEWDQNIPQLSELIREATNIQKIMNKFSKDI